MSPAPALRGTCCSLRWHPRCMLPANTCTATASPAACQPSWLDTGSNGWQLTAATFVGLMSLPGLACLYGGLVPEEVGREHDVHVLHRLLGRARRLGAVGLQDGLRHPDRRWRRRTRSRTSPTPATSSTTSSTTSSAIRRPRSTGAGRARRRSCSPTAARRLPLTAGVDARCSTSSSCSPRSRRCCSSAACSAGSRSRCGSSSSRCGRRSSTR